MGKTLKRQACDHCGSKNNLCFFLNEKGQETSKCMTPDCSYNDQYNDQKPSLMVQEMTTNSADFLVGEAYPIRGISKETMDLYGYFMTELNGQEIYVGNVLDLNDNLISQKLRYPNKVFPWINYKEQQQLFGLHLYDPEEVDTIVITEGYEDAMSVYEAGYAGVSINLGAGKDKTKKEIQTNLKKLEKFKKIILWFDNDEAGQVSLKDALEVLPLGKTFVVDCDQYKDANECWQDPIGKTVEYYLDFAKEVVPEGIVFGDQLNLSDILDPEPKGKELEFPLLQNMLKGIKPSRIYLIGAGTGCGKSTLVKHIIFPWIKEHPDFKIASIFLEEQQKYTLQSLIGMELNKPVHAFEEDPKGILGLSDLQESFKLLNRKTLCFLDHFGSIESQKLLKTLEYLAVVKQFDVIILDHISIAISGLASREGERKDIDILMTKLKELTTRSKTSIITVSHLSRPKGESGFEEGRPVTLNSFRGSGSLCQLSDVVLSIERNTQHPYDKDKTKIRVLKNRITGMLGEADEFRYIENTGRYFIPSKEFK